MENNESNGEAIPLYVCPSPAISQEGRRQRRDATRTVICLVTLPNSVVYSVCVPFDCKGEDCLDEVCRILGIMEKDYFGLKYTEKTTGWNLWINNRLQLRYQMKDSRPPYQLSFWVKYYTDINLLLQPMTKWAFFINMKKLISIGSIRVQECNKPLIGAYLAQAEFGDVESAVNNSFHLHYPQYFPDWQPGVARSIAEEHRKLKGMGKRDAIYMFLEKTTQLIHYGIQFVNVCLPDGRKVRLGFGANAVHVCNWQFTECIKRVPYHHLLMVMYGKKHFTIKFRARNEAQDLVEQHQTFSVPNTKVAIALFRAATEDQVFFAHKTISGEVKQHAQQRNMKALKRFCKKVLRMNMDVETKYYFDIQRTKMEVYSLSWQRLHQLDQEVMDSVADTHPSTELPNLLDLIGLPHELETRPVPNDENINLHLQSPTGMERRGETDGRENISEETERRTTTVGTTATPQAQQQQASVSTRNTSSSTNSSSEEGAGTPTKLKSELFWGLSRSSCNIAKELLQDSQLQQPPYSEAEILEKFHVGTSSTHSDPNSAGESDAADSQSVEEGGRAFEKLSICQGKKLCKLLLKIQDEKTCRICMDQPTSSVFCPCGHSIACYQCAKQVDKCPLCRDNIAFVQFVYVTNA